MLYANGARNFLVTSRDIGLLPRSIRSASDIPERLAELTTQSQQISALFAGTSASFAGATGAEVYYFDLFSFEHTVRGELRRGAGRL
jgi:hypothetical protein